MAVEPIDSLLDVHSIPLARRTVAAFIGRTERGPLNEPVKISDYEDFRRVFGGHCGFSFVSHALQHFFLHGGEVAVVVRVANRATRACIDVPAAGQHLHLQARHPGAHELLRVSVDYDGLHDDPERFNLVVQRMRSPASPLVADQEIFAAISMQHSDPRFVVDALQDSRLVRIAGPLPGNRPDATLPKFQGHPIPYIGMTEAGTDGEDLTDYDIVGSNQEGTGLFALEHAGGFDLLCIPAPPGADVGTTAFLAAERFCEKQRAVLVCDPPWSWTSAHAALIGMRDTIRSSPNAVAYFPRIRPRGEGLRFTEGMPACGAVAGLLARADAAGVWQAAPLGPLRSSLTPTAPLLNADAALLRRFGVNAFAPVPGGTARLEGNVTLAGPNAMSPLWRRLDRRRLYFFIVRSIEETTHWVCADVAASSTASDLERRLRAFFAGLLDRGALAGSHEAQAFFVRVACNRQAQLSARVGFALQRPSEFVVWDYTYTAEGVASRPARALEIEQLLL